MEHLLRSSFKYKIVTCDSYSGYKVGTVSVIPTETTFMQTWLIVVDNINTELIVLPA